MDRTSMYPFDFAQNLVLITINMFPRSAHYVAVCACDCDGCFPSLVPYRALLQSRCVDRVAGLRHAPMAKRDGERGGARGSARVRRCGQRHRYDHGYGEL